MSYVDGYVVPVPTAKKNQYLALAKACAPVFNEHGALRIVENWGEDVPEGKLTSFPLAVALKEDETVVFSWIVWPSKAVRDEGMKKAMEDPRMKPFEGNMPFDGKRMIFGGFQSMLDE
ncbi:DUF1428 domain-containing protein [Aliiglaciecola sp. CAU 1673]|uniref:DUF1428 domain-containing protein n=1 Tax=Aliiglaciecola sp. CAU 1673 TaxID=3032595 RepID=UPI0023DB1382|nr:DUF1428 domain-containing protein [Aliiglaciecola sp. CAU 1673]MDF2178616.1 DUF1428 domain-containing protein [Aliiglaciecola sp. CAU 1673]